MKYYLPFLLFILSIPGLLHAEDISKKQLTDELIERFAIRESVSFDIDQVVDLIIKSEPQFTAYRSSLKEFYTRHLTWEAIKPLFENIIMQEFSEDDLIAINNFLQTKAFHDWIKSQGKVQSLPAAEQKVIMDFTASEVGIHFFKVTEDFVKASNEFIGKITLKNQDELENLIKEQTEQLVK